MSEKLLWSEIKEKYPNQWVSLYDLEHDKDDNLVKAKVHAANEEFKIVARDAKDKNFSSHTFLYTGPINPDLLLNLKWGIRTDASS